MGVLLYPPVFPAFREALTLVRLPSKPYSPSFKVEPPRAQIIPLPVFKAPGKRDRVLFKTPLIMGRKATLV
jgi:hypothetical protein